MSAIAMGAPLITALGNLICVETRTVCQRTFGQALRAIVLTGSLARNEATFVEQSDGDALLGDAEFLLVFHSKSPLPSAADVRRVQTEIEGRLLQNGLRGTMTLSGVRPSYLHRLRPSIFAYELTACGRVVAGDQSVLDLAHRFAPAEIPLEDGWRLLANRIVEQLETMQLRSTDGAPLRIDVEYRTLKLLLDTATSLLVFVGGYRPTYAGRAAGLRLLAGSPSAKEWPFPARPFADVIAACTEWKLTGRQSEGQPLVLLGQAMDYARALWTWELSRLTKLGGHSTADTLMKSWMRCQPLRERVRGWAYVLRRRGWYRTWRNWPRWASLALHGSPRYLVYAAASDLLLATGSLPEAASRRIRCSLPVASAAPNPETASEVSQLALDVLANYYEFLMETRA